MNPESPIPAVSGKALWSGRIMSAVPVLMLLMSGVMKLLKPQPVVDGFVHYGFPLGMVTGLGVLEISCAVVYLIPRTAILGAILATGYLGGATVTTLRVGESSWVMAVGLGILLWGGLYLREPRLRALIPLRR
jgi:DoxX-like family